jgi:TonB-dependent starch-binding outer membrane protein SusC
MKWYKTISLILALCLSQFISGQGVEKNADIPVTITGKVLNMQNKPVPGAVFYIDNIKTNITTKSNGKYKIRVSSSAQTLEVRSPGYGTSLSPINGMTLINFQLAGNGEKMTGVEESRKNPKINRMSRYNNIYDLIKSEVYGVLVKEKSIRIQQTRDFYGTGTPLFTVNGMIVENFDNINPVDVKSVRLLQGSEAAFYGVNGSNGVISIELLNGTEK